MYVTVLLVPSSCRREELSLSKYAKLCILLYMCPVDGIRSTALDELHFDRIVWKQSLKAIIL